jgi:DNA-binding winged helix-turn-helix (wHTH) protein
MRFAFNNFVLDSEQRVLWKEGEAVPLSPKVFETLDLLVQRGGRIVTKQEFMKALWPDSFVEDGNLTQNIFILRKVLGSSDDGHPYIETFPRRGYRFVGAVHPEEAILQEEIVEPSPELESTDAVAEIKMFGPPAIAAPVDGPSLLLEPSQIQTQTLPRGAPPSPQMHLGAIALCALLLLLGVGCAAALHWKARMRVGGYERITNDGRSKDLLNTPSIILVDKNTVYFTEIGGERNILARVSTEGGEVSYDSEMPANVHALGLRSGTQGALLLGTEWPIDEALPLFSKDLATGTVSALFGLRAQDASWSPDGEELAYAQVGNLFVRSKDGSTTRVASVDGIVYWPRWSPDGRIIRFSENYQGFHDRLWQVGSAGGGLHELFANQSDSDHMCCGSWTTSGRGFVYLSIQTNNSKIHVRSEVGSAWSIWPPQSIDISAAPLLPTENTSSQSASSFTAS